MPYMQFGVLGNINLAPLLKHLDSLSRTTQAYPPLVLHGRPVFHSHRW